MEELTSPPRSKFVSQALIFLGIVVLAGALWLAWDKYLSPDARYAREMEQSYGQYQEWENSYKEAIANDTYGGSTPEETLELFIEALEREDVDLASKYFLIDTNNSQKEYREALIVKKEENSLQTIIDILKRVEKSSRNTGSDDIVEFVQKNDGKIIHSIIFKKIITNSSAVIWKIEEM